MAKRIGEVCAMYFDSHSDIWCDVTQQLELGNTDVFNKRHFCYMLD